jgi:hypothetical protein
MIKKLMLTLCAATLAGFAAQAQDGRSCATDEFHKAQMALHPQIAIEEARLHADIDLYMTGKVASQSNKWAKGAGIAEDELLPWPQDVAQYHVPMVVHIIYDNSGTSATITDNDIYGMVQRLNTYYNMTDPALSQIITPWKAHIGNPHITFHLANKDPLGKPTRGIRREFSYTTNGGDESAKLSQWPPDQYLNVYLENYIGRAADKGIVLAYATFPTDYSSNPYSQGVISRADQATATGGNSYTLAHEIGHYLYLNHVWATNGKAVEDTVCGDDEVDDTPPTLGHFSCGTAKLYDTVCAKGYLKDYDSTTFYHITAETGIIASNTSRTDAEMYSGSSNVIGQSFTTGSKPITLQNIAIRLDTLSDTGNNNAGTISMNLYNAAGTTLIASSTNSVTVDSNTTAVSFSFNNVLLTANTNYKFVIVTLSGTTSFYLHIANSGGGGPYSNGVMYHGANAGSSVNDADILFTVTQLRRIDYPDTTNTQNIMDYSGCPAEMFTKGQVARMRGALRSDVGFRNKLIDTANLIRTGVMDAGGNILPPADIIPTALFTASRPFTCAGNTNGITFSSRSYNDTIVAAEWNFDKGASDPTSSNVNTVNNSFSETGWVTVSLNVTGNNSGTSPTYTRNDLVYVADPVGVQPYIEEFNQTDMLSRFPIFNFFSHPAYKWEVTNKAGTYDNTSMKFNNYDLRDQGAVNSGIAVNTATLSPRGLYADFYTPAYDLSGFGGNCFLGFHSAGAYRTVNTKYMNDTLLISYSTNCGSTWNNLGRVTRGDLANNGYKAEPFMPSYPTEWKEQSFPIASAVRTEQVYFRFRYFAGTDNAYLRFNGLDFGTGNNFYLDRLMVTDRPLNVKNGVIVKLGMTVSPNPTSGAAIVRLNGGDNSTAEVNVTDVTGKLVYQTSAVRTSATTEIEIPASSLTVKGIYLVHVVTNGATETQKLVVY